MRGYFLLGISIPICIVVLALWGLSPYLQFDNLSSILYRYIIDISGFSFLQASLSTIGAALLAVPLAIYIHRNDTLFARIIKKLCDMIIVAPVLVIILSLAMIYGNNGWYTQLVNNVFHTDSKAAFYGLSGIVLGHIFFNAPLIARFINNDLSSASHEYTKIAAQLNFNAMARFTHLYQPIIKSSLVHSIPLVFALCFTSFAIVLIMGANPTRTTIEVAIYQSLKYEFAFSKAIVLTLIQMALLCFIAFIWYLLLMRNAARQAKKGTTINQSNRYQLTRTFGERIGDGITLILCLLFFFPPMLALLIRGINADSISILISPAFYQSIGFSVAIGGLSALISVAAAYFIIIGTNHRTAHRTGLFSLVALLIPSLLLAMGVFLALRSTGQLAFAGFIAVCLITALKILPFAVVLILPYAHTLIRRYQRLRRQVEFSNHAYNKVVLYPLLKRHLLSAFLYLSILSLGDFSTIALFGSESMRTLPYLMYQYYGSYNINEAYTLALLLFTLIALVFSFGDKIYTPLKRDK